MHAERLMLETDENGLLRSMPTLPPSSRIEAILIFPDKGLPQNVRVPHPKLSAITVIHGDIVSPAASEEEWEALQ